MKISMITICLNSEKTIERTIESVLSQQNVELEYIIIDGKSTDRTLEILEKYSNRIDIIISEKDNGISDAFNKGIRISTGDIVGIINSDDRLRDGALQHLIEVVQPDTDVLFGHGIRDYQDGSGKRYLADPDPQKLREGMSMVHPSVFVRKHAYDRFGLFDPSFRYTMDRELLLRFLNHGARFQYDDYYYAFYSMGGVSDKSYTKNLSPEKMRIDKSEGKSTIKCREIYLKSAIRNKLVALRNHLGLDYKRRSLDYLLEEISKEGK